MEDFDPVFLSLTLRGRERAHVRLGVGVAATFKRKKY